MLHKKRQKVRPNKVSSDLCVQRAFLHCVHLCRLTRFVVAKPLHAQNVTQSTNALLSCQLFTDKLGH